MRPNKKKLKKTKFSLEHIEQFDPALEYTHTFHSDLNNVKGIQLVTLPKNNVHNSLYQEAIKYIDNKINAIDVGCRDGEFTRYLTWGFNHVYCYDYRKRIQFPMNINLSKVTHYKCAIGKIMSMEQPSGRGNLRNKIVDKAWVDAKLTRVFPLDYFQLENINLIKIDVDGMDKEVVEGAIETIKKYKPVIIIEEVIMDGGIINHHGVEYIKSLGYKTVHVRESSPIHKDYILISSN